MANSFTFNATNLSTLGVLLQKTSFPSMAKPVIDIQQAAYGRAGSYQQRFASKQFELPIIIEATDSATLFENLDSLGALFNQDAEKPLSFDYFYTDRYWNARYLGGLENVEFLNQSKARASVQFVAPDGVAYSNTDSSSAITVTSTTFNHTTSELDGNTITNPVITITATNGASGVTVYGNRVPGVLNYAATLSNGHMLRIDSQNFLAQKSTNGGSTWTNAMANVSGSFPRLLGGITNTISVLGVNNGGSLSLEYTGRFL